MLNTGELCPNTANRKDHLWKIVCGAGSHSRNNIGLLKYKISDWLEHENIEHFGDLDNGVFLVRLTKMNQPLIANKNKSKY